METMIAENIGGKKCRRKTGQQEAEHLQIWKKAVFF